MLYILVVEENSDFRELIELALTKSFPQEVVSAHSGNQAIEIMKVKGFPEVIITDDEMSDGNGTTVTSWLKIQKPELPLIVCAAGPLKNLKNKYPQAFGHVEKPNISLPLQELVNSILVGQKTLLSHVPISISLLLKLGKIEFNLYMRLSYLNYVKVLKAGETFIISDAERFFDKNINHLYVTAPDSSKFMETFENNLRLVMDSESMDTDEAFALSIDSLNTVERMASVLGWTPQIVNSASKSVNFAIRAVAANPSIIKILNQKLQASPSYSKHVTYLSMITCCICQQLGWVSESSQMKLAMASLLHDMALDEEIYENIEHWNECARNFQIKDLDAMKYRNHSVEVVTLLQKIKDLPPDVDHIILQHHESPDGRGFPYRLSVGRISPMACVFIFAEDLVNTVDVNKLEKSIEEFIQSREEKYQIGMFKKVFTVFKDGFKNTQAASR